MKRRIAALIWLTLACLAVYGASCAANTRFSPAVYLDWDADCASYAEAAAAAANGDAPVNIAVWTVSGDLALYAGDWRLLTGDSLIYGQRGGLMINSALALERFGSENVAGREIDMGGETRVISGVYASGVAKAILEDADDYKPRAHMALGFPAASAAKWSSEAKTLLESMGLPAPRAEKDTALLYSIRDMSFFKSLVPTRWSDFDGWRDNADALVNRLSAFISAELAPVQAECLWECLKLAALFTLAIVLSARALISLVSLARKKT